MWTEGRPVDRIPLRVGRYYDHAFLLEHFASWLRPKVYVELGTADYATFLRVAPYCGKAVGVDVRPAPPVPAELEERCTHYQLPTAAFLAETVSELGEVEMAFIDADHEADAAFADFCGLWSLIPPGGFVFLHDTYPPDQQHTVPALCHDSWRVPAMIEQRFSGEAELLTLPFPPGLTIVRRRNVPKL